ncbi:MAG: biotin/lipoyl-containing protein [Vicinamibacterales bacterium]
MADSRRFIVRQGDVATVVGVLADGRISVGDEAEAFVVTLIAPGDYLVTRGEDAWRVAVAGPPDARWVSTRGTTVCVDVQPEGGSGAPRKRAVTGGLSAPMPGTVIEITAVLGQHVRAGDVLLKLEAMKMELPIRAPRDGVVTAIHCAIGELVQPGPPLVELA